MVGVGVPHLKADRVSADDGGAAINRVSGLIEARQ